MITDYFGGGDALRFDMEAELKNAVKELGPQLRPDVQWKLTPDAEKRVIHFRESLETKLLEHARLFANEKKGAIKPQDVAAAWKAIQASADWYA